MEWVLSAVIAATVFVHGGFYPGAALAGGAACCAAALFIKKPRIGRTAAVMICFDVWILACSVINGYSASSLARACLPLAATMFLICAGSLTGEQRKRLFGNILTVSGIIAVIGLAAVTGLVSPIAATGANRLQFPFEYANTLGAWLGASAMLGWERRDKRTDWTRLPILTALFLTRSVGALGVYMLAWVVRALPRFSKKDEWQEWVIVHGTAGAFAAVFYLARSPAAAILIPVLAVVSHNAERLTERAKRLRVQYAFIAIGCAGIALMLAGGRARGAVGTFAERLAQMRDGLAIIGGNPIFGVGAGNWERVYTRYQSAQYRSTIIHSSIIGAGVDGGLPAVALLGLAVFFGWKIKGRGTGESFAAAVMMAHSLFDVDFTYFPVLALAMSLCAAGEEKTVCGKRTPEVVVSVLSLGVMAFSAFAGRAVDRLTEYTYNGEWGSVISSYERDRWMIGSDREGARMYAGALYLTGEADEALRALGDPDELNEWDMDLYARILRTLEREEEAYETYLRQLEKRPCDVRMFEAARDFLTGNDAPEEYLRRYNELARRANERGDILSGLMGNQEEIDEIIIDGR